MSSYEERQELIQVARDLQAELRNVTTRVHAITNKLLTEADALMVPAANEMSKGETVTKTPITLGTLTATGTGMAKIDTTLKPVALAPGKRACSLCRQPGHRAQNCPNAHVVRDQQKAEHATREVKSTKTKRTLTPERKAQLVETLKKARAARKRK